MSANKVEKQCFVVLNLKLQLKVRFKTCYRLLELLYSAFAFNTTAKTTWFARNFCISQQQACNLQTGPESLQDGVLYISGKERDVSFSEPERSNC